jgi:SAM-dependent methyltransferase
VTAAGYDDALFPLLEELEPQSFWFRARNDLIVWALRRYYAGASSLLEIGCGTGFVLQGIHEALPALELRGGELSDAGASIARRRLPGVPVEQLDALDLPYTGVFDVVCAFDVLEHIEDDRSALAGLAGAARPGGGVLVTVPQHPFLWSVADEIAHHLRRYTRLELTDKLQGAGLRVLRTTSFVSLLLPLMIASRLRYRVAPHRYDLQSELVVGQRATVFLERVLQLERAAIRRGVSLPVGGSLLAIAQKA